MANRILLVDDENDFIELLQYKLARQGTTSLWPNSDSQFNDATIQRPSLDTLALRLHFLGIEGTT